jgi:hypothetical protein
LEELEIVEEEYGSAVGAVGGNKLGGMAAAGMKMSLAPAGTAITFATGFKVVKRSKIKKLKWAASGKEKAVSALKELRVFVDELYGFVPINDWVIIISDIPAQQSSHFQATASSTRVTEVNYDCQSPEDSQQPPKASTKRLIKRLGTRQRLRSVARKSGLRPGTAGITKHRNLKQRETSTGTYLFSRHFLLRVVC